MWGRIFVRAGALLLSLALVGCGGGGAGGASAAPAPGTPAPPGTAPSPSPGPAPEPSPPPVPSLPVLSGRVVLGPVEAATVVVTTYDNIVIHRLRTDATGAFGPVPIPSGFDGVVFLRAELTETSRFPCDAIRGCVTAGGRVSFGESVTAVGQLRALVPVEDLGSRPVVLSPFTHAAALRAESLTAGARATVEATRVAHQEMSELLNRVLGELPGAPRVGADYYEVPLPNLATASSPELESAGAAGVALALLGAALLEVELPRFTPGEPALATIEAFARGLRVDGRLPDRPPGNDRFLTPETWIGNTRASLARWESERENGNERALTLAERLPGASFESLRSAVDGWRGLPARLPQGALALDDELTGNFDRDAFVVERRERLLAPVDAPNFAGARLRVVSGAPWITGRVVPVDSLNRPLSAPGAYPAEAVRVAVTYEFDTAAVRDLSGPFEVPLEVIDDFGRFRTFRLVARVGWLQRNIVFVEGAESPERGTLSLAPVSTALDPASLRFRWRQRSGAPGVLADTDRATVRFTAPSVDADQTLVLTLEVTDRYGMTAVQDVPVEVEAYETVAAFRTRLPAFADCRVGPEAPADVGLIRSLSCPPGDLGSLLPLERFASLERLDVAGSSFVDGLSALSALEELREIDLGAAPRVACAGVDAIRSALPAVSILGGEACVRGVTVPVQGDRLVVLPRRGEVYLAGAFDRELVVLDLASGQVQTRIPLPGNPKTLRATPDEDTVFVTLHLVQSPIRVDTRTREARVHLLRTVPRESRLEDVFPLADGDLLLSASVPDPLGGFRQAILVDGAEPPIDLLPAAPAGTARRGLQAVLAGDGRTLYVGSTFEDRIFRIRSAAAGPEVDPPISVPPSFRLGPSVSVSADGSRLFDGATGEFRSLPDFELLATEAVPDLFVQALYGPGRTPLLVSLGDFVSTVPAPAVPYVFDDSPGGVRPIYDAPLCPRGPGIGEGERALDDEGTGFVWLAGQEPCLVGRRNRVATAVRDVEFKDPVLAACVEEARQRTFVPSARTLRSLDCSAFPGIRSLDGVQYLLDLRELRISNSRIANSGPLRVLAQRSEVLTSVAILDDPLFGDLERLESLPVLDLSGSEQISCRDVVSLARTAQVITSGCVEPTFVELDALVLGAVHDAEARRLYVRTRDGDDEVVLELDDATYAQSRSFRVSGGREAMALDPVRDLLALGSRQQLDVIDLSSGLVRSISPELPFVSGSRLEVAFVAPGVLVAAVIVGERETSAAVRIDTATGAELVRTPLASLEALPVSDLELLDPAGIVARSSAGALVELDRTNDAFSIRSLLAFDWLAIPRDDSRLRFDLLRSFSWRLEPIALRETGSMRGSILASPGPGRVILARDGRLDLWDTASLSLVATRGTGCGSLFSTGVVVGERMILPDGDRLCVVPLWPEVQ